MADYTISKLANEAGVCSRNEKNGTLGVWHNAERQATMALSAVAGTRKVAPLFGRALLMRALNWGAHRIRKKLYAKLQRATIAVDAREPLLR